VNHFEAISVEEIKGIARRLPRKRVIEDGIDTDVGPLDM